jgi:protein TonB
MELQKLLRADYLDILFDGRNKDYGGYELRRKYADRARRATAMVLLGAALAATIPVIAAHLAPGDRVSAIPRDRVHELYQPPVEIPEHPPVRLPAPPAPSVTIARPTFKIVENDKVTEAPKSMTDIRAEVIALTDRRGDGGIPSFDGGIGLGQAEVEMPAEKKVHVAVEQMPAFDGDLSQYLREHLQYPDQARESGQEGRVGIRFVVNEDGSISDVEVTHKAGASLDAEARRVVSGMPRWKPGKQGGKAVRVYFTLPIIFELE